MIPVVLAVLRLPFGGLDVGVWHAQGRGHGASPSVPLFGSQAGETFGKATGIRGRQGSMDVEYGYDMDGDGNRSNLNAKFLGRIFD